MSMGRFLVASRFSDPVAGEGELILEVLAAALKPLDKAIAAGSHYATPRKLPVVCGLDGTRVFFAGLRAPFGAMAERTVVDQARCMTLPEGLDTLVAAALPNPGMSAWLSLTYRAARLLPGETVRILGATGVAGQLAVQIAKLLGARPVVELPDATRRCRAGCASWGRMRPSGSDNRPRSWLRPLRVTLRTEDFRCWTTSGARPPRRCCKLSRDPDFPL